MAKKKTGKTQLETIMDYLKDHPDAAYSEVSRALGKAFTHSALTAARKRLGISKGLAHRAGTKASSEPLPPPAPRRGKPPGRNYNGTLSNRELFTRVSTLITRVGADRVKKMVALCEQLDDDFGP